MHYSADCSVFPVGFRMGKKKSLYLSKRSSPKCANCDDLWDYYGLDWPAYRRGDCWRNTLPTRFELPKHLHINSPEVADMCRWLVSRTGEIPHATKSSWFTGTYQNRGSYTQPREQFYIVIYDRETALEFRLRFLV